MDDVIRLISKSYLTDEYGNQIEKKVERVVFCKVNSVGRTEFYSAAQADMHLSYIFTISHYKDYQNEKELAYIDWTGEKRYYTITRTYRTGDKLEITAEERVANYEAG